MATRSDLQPIHGDQPWAKDILQSWIRLAPHLRPGGAAVTGSFAMHVGLQGTEHSVVHSFPADLDILVAEPEAISHSVADQFLVSHYHRGSSNGAKFILQLVDPIAPTRIDLFEDAVGSVSRVSVETVGGIPVPMLDLSTILDHKLRTLRRAEPKSPVDPKHLRDAKLLAALLGRPAVHIAPDRLAEEVYATDVTLRCEACELNRSEELPLAPKTRIFELLGYV